MIFRVDKMVDELGGASKAAEAAGLPRTAPYRWLRSMSLSLDTLLRIKTARPEIVLDNFMEDEAHERKDIRTEDSSTQRGP
ncbi:MAG: hypothetical protein P8R39_11405 [Alphaproteobacteria bacterium]|nr:hypothetical protein [Alphaproteobacteria bacterium]